jgi:hypothetical protein
MCLPLSGCEAVSCLNGGTCVDTAAGGTCQCGSIFTGTRCESYGKTSTALPIFENLMEFVFAIFCKFTIFLTLYLK